MARLLIVSSEFPPGPGGIGTHAFQLARHLQRLSHAVAVITRQDYASPDQIAEFNRQSSFPIHSLPQHPNAAREGWLRYQSVLKASLDFQPDLILASGSRSVWLAALIKAVRRIPYLAAGHGTEFGIPGVWERFITRQAFSHAGAVVCVSQYTRSRLIALGVSSDREVVITNGADGETFHPLSSDRIMEIRQSIGVKDEFVLLTVGNVTERKGQDIIIRALPQIMLVCPDIKYWIVGLPTNRNQLELLSSELGVTEQVKFWGNVTNEQLVQIYNAADLFVLTSRQTADGDFEGYGIVAAEAALCGKAAVVSKGSGLEEAVIHGQTGLHVPPEDPNAAAEVITRLITQPDELVRLGQNACRRADESQTWQVVAGEYDRLIRTLI